MEEFTGTKTSRAINNPRQKIHQTRTVDTGINVQEKAQSMKLEADNVQISIIYLLNVATRQLQLLLVFEQVDLGLHRLRAWR